MAVTIKHGKQLDPGTGLPRNYLQTRPLDKTRLSMLPRNAAADATQLALFQLQDLSPEEMVMGSAMLFALMAERCGLQPDELHGMAMSVLKAPDEGDTVTGDSLQALRDFGAIRVMGRDTTFY